MKLKQLENKKILILGFGKEGQDTYLALRKLFPIKNLGIADGLKIEGLKSKIKNLIKRDKHLELHFGKNYLQKLKKYEVIIKSPGIFSQTINRYLSKKQKITSQTEIFLENCPAKIIGITGTKGKGTTASLIYQILKKSGLNAHLIGNIGQPVFQFLLQSKKEDIFIYELSSYQLEKLKKSPQIAVFLDIYPAHLDHHRTFKKYQKAKENITIHQSKNDFFIYNSSQKEIRDISQKTKAKKITFNPKKLNHLKKIISLKQIPLKGEFNLLNILAAVLVCEILKIPRIKIKEGVKSFKSLPCRLEPLGQYQGINFYNDSLATVPQSVEAALTALGEKVETLILGGMKVKDIDFSSLAEKILKEKIKTLVLFPDTGEEIWRNIEKRKPAQRKFNILFTPSMKKAVQYAYQKTSKEKICLLSPGAPSQNIFKNYQERGDLFEKFVNMYGSKKSS